jgi:hypothetical protein
MMTIRVAYDDGSGTILGGVIRVQGRADGHSLDIKVETDSVGAVSFGDVVEFEVSD